MFWNTNNSNNKSPTDSPAHRRDSSSGSSSPYIAPTIRGSIRPPNQQSYSRQEHLDSYLNDETLKRSTRKVSDDDSTYDTVFLSTYGDTLILRVHWPALTASTQTQPAMTLAGVNAKHPWLDSRMCITGYGPIQSLQAWLSSRILLGKAVHEVVQYLQLNPPEIIEITDQGLRSIQQPKTLQQQQMQKQQQQQQQNVPYVRTSNTHSPPRTSVTNSTGNHAPPNRLQENNNYHDSVNTLSAVSVRDAPPPKYDSINNNDINMTTTFTNIPTIDMPPTPNRFDEIDQLSREEVENLLNDQVEFTLFCNKLPIIQTYQKILHTVIDDNVVIAKKNLTSQEKLNDLYNEVNTLQQQLKNNIQTFQELEKKQDTYCLPPDIKVIMKELNKNKKDTFDESENMANKWLQASTDNSNNSIDTFLDAFVKKRKEHHEYAAKLELLMIQSSGGAGTSSRLQPPPRY